MKISVIIPTHNRADQLRQALTAIAGLSSESDFEVVVVDNNSTDHTRQTAESFGNRITYVFEERTAFSRARRTGAQAATGDIFLYIDDDVILRTGAFKGLVQLFRSHADCGMVAGRIDPQFTESPTAWTLACNKEFNGWSLYNPQTIHFLKDELCTVPWAAGPMMAIRREVYESTGGFPPDTIGVETNIQEGTFRKLYVGNGDIGLSEKITASGLNILYHPDVACFHVIPPIRFTLGFWRSRMIGEGHAMAVTQRCFYGKNDSKIFIERKRVQIRYLNAMGKLLVALKNLNDSDDGGTSFHGMLPEELWARYCMAYLELDGVLSRNTGLADYLWSLGAEGVANNEFQDVIQRLPQDYLEIINRNVFDAPEPVDSVDAFQKMQTELSSEIRAECQTTRAILEKTENILRRHHDPGRSSRPSIHAFFDDADTSQAVQLLRQIQGDQSVQAGVNAWLAAFDGKTETFATKRDQIPLAGANVMNAAHSEGVNLQEKTLFPNTIALSKSDAGYLLIATEKKGYLNIAVNAALSIRRLDDRPICLVMDEKVILEDQYHCFFDEIKVVQNAGVAGAIHKLYAYDYSPFKKTMFVDTDCLMVKNDIGRFWEKFDGSGLIFEGCAITTGTAHKKSAAFLRQRYHIEFIANFNSGVFYFEKSPIAESVFKKTQELYHSADRDLISYKFLPGLYGDEGFFGVAMGIYHIKPLPITNRMKQLQVPTPYSRDHHINLDRGECFFIIGKNLEEAKIFSGTICHFCGVEPRSDYLMLASQLRRKADLSPYENLH